MQDLVRRGIPHHFRGIVWQLLCGAHDSPDKAKYADYIKATSACEKVGQSALHNGHKPSKTINLFSILHHIRTVVSSCPVSIGTSLI